MTLRVVTTLPPAAPELSDRAAAALVRSGTEGSGFSQALSRLTPANGVVTVRPGDTLSGLIQKQLRETNAPFQLSGEQLYRVALKVAGDNAIANANLIYPDQRIDLSSVDALAMAEALKPDSPALAAAPAAPLSPPSAAWGDGPPLSGPRGFWLQHAQAARQAQASTGIPAAFMVAQAALETGWGRQEIRFPDGQTSHNLFGIRAGASWKGPVAEIWTTEYVNGSPQRVRGQFRAYASYQESFNDYARLISQSPRYAQAMRHLNDPQAFAASLQQAGYATAPHYASVLASTIQTTLRLQDNLSAATPAPAMPSTAQVLGMRASSTWGAMPAANTVSASPGRMVFYPDGDALSPQR